MAAFWIFGKTHRLKTMVKNAASKNAGFTPNFAKKPPQKTVFRLYLENDKRYRKKSQTKVVDRKILYKNDLSFFLFLIKLSLRKACKSCKQLAAGGAGRRGLLPRGCGSGSALRRRSEALGRIRRGLAMLSYERARGLC